MMDEPISCYANKLSSLPQACHCLLLYIVLGCFESSQQHQPSPAVMALQSFSSATQQLQSLAPHLP